MTAEAVPTPHGRPISVAEFDALPVDTSHRYEIENGLLLVNARPAPPHSRAIIRLIGQLNEQLPPEWEAFAELEVELVGRSPRRVPDVVVVPVDVDEQVRVRSEQIVLAVEVASTENSAVRDYSIKAGEYAANGIAHYWVIDILEGEPVGLTVYTLDETGQYRISQRVTGVAKVDMPFALTIDLDSLTSRRGGR
ncbi:Uma2 family endonuclease [Nocardia jejuensis]|uniref:Uma2 family endonuclease n=1 Tax=Nocardia jejuensis TaxID=328049 RepID=UPI0008348150|nr:Uma2 family endonuclease [Nocardia jejuensis]